MRPILTGIIVIVGMMTGMARSISAAPLAECVPAEAAFYIGWRGSRAAGGQYETSHLAGVLEHTRFRELVAAIPSILEHPRRQMGPRAREAVQQATKRVLPALWRHPWAVYAAPSSDAGQSFKAALILKAGDQADAVKQGLSRLLTMARQANPSIPPLNVTAAKGLVTARFGPPADENGPPLAKREEFTRALRQINQEGLGVLYLDVARLPLPPSLQKPWQDLGLDHLNQLAASTGFHGKRWQTDLFLHAPASREGEREGVLSLLEGKPIGEAMLRLIPRDVTWINAFRFDPAKALDRLREFMQASDPRSAQRFESMLQRVNMMTGVKLEEDLLAGLGPVWLAYNEPSVAGPVGLGAVAVNPLRDAQTVRRSLTRLERMANGMLLQQQQGTPMRWRMITTNHEGVTLHSAVAPLISPTWAIHDGRLYVGLLPQAVVTAMRDREESILNNPKFTAVQGKLQAGTALNGISYLDLEATAPMTYQGYLMLTQAIPAAGVLFGGDGPAMVLPALTELMPYLHPAAGASWTDQAGWHGRFNSPFPGSTLLGRSSLASLYSGQMSVSAVAMLTGILMPAISQARESAIQMASLSNLRQIGLALHAYANDHESRFPDKLGALAAETYIDQTVFVHPGRGVPEVPEDQSPQWIDEHSDYIYVHPGKKAREINNPSEMIIVFEPPSFPPEGFVNALFVDGHAQAMSMDRLKRMLKEQTGNTMNQLIREAEAGAGEDAPPPPPPPPGPTR